MWRIDRAFIIPHLLRTQALHDERRRCSDSSVIYNTFFLLKGRKSKAMCHGNDVMELTNKMLDLHWDDWLHFACGYFFQGEMGTSLATVKKYPVCLVF